MTNSINKQLRLKIHYTHNANFNLKSSLIAFAKPNLSQIYILILRASDVGKQVLYRDFYMSGWALKENRDFINHV